LVVDSGRFSSNSDWFWSTKFAWLPAKMDSDVSVWFKNYYHGVRFIYGPAGEEPVVLHQYKTAEEFIWEVLVLNTV